MAAENVIVAVDVMVKGTSGLLIPLGIENYVTAVQAIYLYNLISIALVMFVAGFSSQKSESAFCIITSFTAGLMIFFGWMRAATAAEQTGLIVLTAICALLGVFLYANDQNRNMHGSGGPGSKMIAAALMIALFTGCYTMISDFNIFPGGHPMPATGTCAAGFSCDAYNNIDFTTTSASFGNNGGLGSDAISALVALPGAVLSMIILLLKICVGVFAFPLVINGIMNGLYPGITSNAMYIAFMGIMEVAILAIYALGVLELLRGAPGSTI